VAGPAAGGVTPAVGQQLDEGTPPAQVAELVVAAVRDKRFWIFSHRKMFDLVEARMAAMRNGWARLSAPSDATDRRDQRELSWME
jgi:hypothetical protein